MKLYPINAGNFKLDGGAMFGVVPKSLWTRTNPADTNNMIDIAARCLLIEDGNRLIHLLSVEADVQMIVFVTFPTVDATDETLLQRSTPRSFQATP